MHRTAARNASKRRRSALFKPLLQHRTALHSHRTAPPSQNSSPAYNSHPSCIASAVNCFLSCISWSTALFALARSRCEKRSGVGSHGPALQSGVALLAPASWHCLQDLMRSTPSHGTAGNLHFVFVRLPSLALPPQLLAEPYPAQVPSTSPWPWVGNWAPSQHCSVWPALLALPCTRSLFCSFGSNETQMGLAIGPAQRTVQP